jgi:hypothetical protein
VSRHKTKIHSTVKKRIRLHGKGKRSSHGTIILMNIQDKAIFAHGFDKGEKGNIANI